MVSLCFSDVRTRRIRVSGWQRLRIVRRRRERTVRAMPIEPLLWMFFGVAFFSLGLLVGYGMCEDKQNRRKDGENHDAD